MGVGRLEKMEGGTELGIFCDRNVSVRLKESVELCGKITDDGAVVDRL